MAKFSDRTNALLDILSDRPIAYHPALAKIVGGAKAAIWVSQMLYWDGKGKKRGGWIYKTQQDWQEETGLTRTEQETVRRKLVSNGFMEEKKCGVPCTLHYRLNYEALVDQAVETQQSSLQEPCNLDCGNPANLSAETLQSIPETTQEITTETTTEQPRDFLDDLFDHSFKKKKNDRPEGWARVDADIWEICRAVAEGFPCNMPVVKSHYPSNTKEMARKKIDDWIGGAIFILENFNSDARSALGAIGAFRLEYDGGFIVAGPQSLVSSLSPGDKKPKKRSPTGKQGKQKRREYEPCTDDERKIAWRLHGDALLAWIEDRGTDANLGAVTGAIANALRIDGRTAQALDEAYAVRRALALPRLDVATFFDE